MDFTQLDKFLVKQFKNDVILILPDVDFFWDNLGKKMCFTLKTNKRDFFIQKIKREKLEKFNEYLKALKIKMKLDEYNKVLKKSYGVEISGDYFLIVHLKMLPRE